MKGNSCPPHVAALLDNHFTMTQQHHGNNEEEDEDDEDDEDDEAVALANDIIERTILRIHNQEAIDSTKLAAWKQTIKEGNK